MLHSFGSGTTSTTERQMLGGLRARAVALEVEAMPLRWARRGRRMGGKGQS